MPFGLLKQALTNLGPFVSERGVHNLNAAVSYLETGRWLAAHGFKVPRRSRSRDELFDLILNDVRDQRVLYLEFGVFEGAATRYWAQRLSNPESALHGFDSFEGLPETWNSFQRRGHFNTGGVVPAIDDPRVRFFKGWFDQTLPHYQPPPHDRLVINMDADLYSSSIYVLRHLRPLIVEGTYLYFDEFADRLNELRAFAEFQEETGMRFDLLGANGILSQMVFRRRG